MAHLVLSSVACAGEATGIPVFESKWRFEQFLESERAAGRAPPTTVLAPVGFMEAFETLPYSALRQGVVPSLLSAGRRVQLVSAEDLGAFACMAFEQPARWVGRRFELAGDERSAEEICEAIAAARGEAGQWRVVSPPDLLVRMFEPAALARFRGWLEEVGAHVDIEAVRSELPGLMTIEEYLRRRGFDNKELPPAGWMMCAVM